MTAHDKGRRAVTIQIPAPDIDESDPLGLGDLSASLSSSQNKSAHETLDLTDLTAIAGMARRVEDARFAAERRLHDSLRSTPSKPIPVTPVAGPATTPPRADRPRPSIDPVVRRIAAQAELAAAANSAMASAPPVPEQAAPPALPMHASAATAALRDLMSDPDKPAPTPPPVDARTPTTSDAVAPPGMPRPANLRPDPRPEQAPGTVGIADTASLLRELASLSGQDDNAPASPPPATGPRPAQRPPASGSPVSRPRRKSLFTR
jgi:hypothetical protein